MYSQLCRSLLPSVISLVTSLKHYNFYFNKSEELLGLTQFMAYCACVCVCVCMLYSTTCSVAETIQTVKSTSTSSELNLYFSNVNPRYVYTCRFSISYRQALFQKTRQIHLVTQVRNTYVFTNIRNIRYKKTKYNKL